MWHDVPNRAGRITIVPIERALGDIGLSSGWQGDNSGRTVPGAEQRLRRVPVAQKPRRLADHRQGDGAHHQRVGQELAADEVHTNPLPYRPASLDTRQASLDDPRVGDASTARSARPPKSLPATGRSPNATPTIRFPGTPDPTQICLKNGFDPKLLYQVVFTAKDPPVLGIGFAAFRDVASFFAYAEPTMPGRQSRSPTGSPGRSPAGISQSGNFIRGFLHFGFNQDEAGRQVYDGAWPIIAGRRIALNYPLRHARRRAQALRARQRRPAMVGRCAGPGPRLAVRRHSRPLHREQHLPEDHRAFRRRRGLGPEAHAGMGRPAAIPTCRCRTMCGATTFRARSTAAAAAASHGAAWRRRPVPSVG